MYRSSAPCEARDLSNTASQHDGAVIGLLLWQQGSFRDTIQGAIRVAISVLERAAMRGTMI